MLCIILSGVRIGYCVNVSSALCNPMRNSCTQYVYNRWCHLVVMVNYCLATLTFGVPATAVKEYICSYVRLPAILDSLDLLYVFMW